MSWRENCLFPESMKPYPLTIHVFGSLRVLVDAGPLPRMRTRSVEWLLALLVLRHGRTVDRSWLAGTLWPDSEESQALRNSRDALFHLRTSLGRQGAPSIACGPEAPSSAIRSRALTGCDSGVGQFQHVRPQ